MKFQKSKTALDRLTPEPYMTNEIPRRRGTPAQRAIAAQAIRSIRRTTPTSGLRCLHHAADDLTRFL